MRSKISHFKLSLSVAAGMCAFIFSAHALAKQVDLLDAPKNGSKVVGKIDPANGITPIFQPKKSEWVKVADPSNGHVGWVRAKELGLSNFHYQYISHGNGRHGYRVVQYGGTQPYNAKEIRQMVDNMNMRQRAMRVEMQRAMDHMFASMHPYPVFMPVVFVPVQQKTGLGSGIKNQRAEQHHHPSV